MTRTNGMPVGAGVRERLRAAQRAESEAIGAVQKAEAALVHARARLEKVILKREAEVSKAAHAVQETQAAVVRISGIGRAATLLDISPTVLKSAVRETSQDAVVQRATIQGASVQHASVQEFSVQDASGQARSSNTPAATTAPTIAPTNT